MSTLICAANGRTQRYLIAALIANKYDINSLRLHVYREQSVDALLKDFSELQNSQFLVADFLDAKAMKHAMEGVAKVWYNTPPFRPLESAMAISVIDAAKAAGVQHFVFCSVFQPFRSKLLNHDVKRPAEEYLVESRLNYTILQPTHFIQNVALPPVQSSGVLPLAWNPAIETGFIDLEDLADIGVKVLTDPASHQFASYELLGENISYDGVAKILSEAYGKDIKCVKVAPEEALVKAKENGIVPPGSEYSEDAVIRMWAYYDRWGLVGNPNILHWLLGRKPSGWKDYIQKQATK
ncbi:NAD(P)-binding protein [Sistotremastrum suecicum HHB10207 ss-3]|uniref:NAD(P)-binding protein n=1 Tax=Sistotremastrum suecicum HHB10207 ss-3 TaxID=1314776 RepID=A0A166GZR7_9AGAM|nr:NAD(P)-binding protein [Sistotremastrum suecicum HHB10207 ss-3]